MNIIFCCITKRYLRLRHGSDLTWSRAISCLAVTFKNPWAAAFMISVATGVAYIAVPIWYVLLQKSVNPGAMATGAGFYNGTCYVLSSIAPVVLGWAAGIIGFGGGFLLMIVALLFALHGPTGLLVAGLDCTTLRHVWGL